MPRGVYDRSKSKKNGQNKGQGQNQGQGQAKSEEAAQNQQEGRSRGGKNSKRKYTRRQNQNQNQNQQGAQFSNPHRIELFTIPGLISKCFIDIPIQGAKRVPVMCEDPFAAFEFVATLADNMIVYAPAGSVYSSLRNVRLVNMPQQEEGRQDVSLAKIEQIFSEQNQGRTQGQEPQQQKEPQQQQKQAA